MKNLLLHQQNGLSFKTKVGAVCAAVVCSISGSNAGTTDHLEMGLELVENLLNYQTAGQFEDGDQIALNQYGGSWGQGTLIVEPGDPNNNQLPYNKSKCGSFVTKLLNHSYNWNWSDYSFYDPNQGEDVTTASPNAHRYMELITQQVGFSDQISHLSDILPGDVMVKRDVGTTTGHVWIVKDVILGQPMPYPANMPDTQNHLIGTTYYEVDVLDCSSGYHSNDTRKVFYNGQLHETHGAGVGTIGVLVDANGVVIGHTWSLPSSNYNNNTANWVSQLNSKIELLDETEFVIGRLDLIDEGGIPNEELPDSSGDNADNSEDSIDEISQGEEEIPSTVIPHFLQLGRTLLSQIQACHSEGIFFDTDGVEINRRGGSWGSYSNPVYIRFADLGHLILPANHTKGATLVSLLLKEAYGHSWKDHTFFDSKLNGSKTTSSPSSTRYVDLIEQQIGFSAQIHQLTNAKAGDILAIRYLSSWSGHTMIINHIDWSSAVEYPNAHPDADTDWNNTWYVPVQVLDSTSSPHSMDSRIVEGEKTEGIGTGTIGILMNESCEIVGHTWSIPSADPIVNQDSWLSQLHSRIKPQTVRKMVVGRFE